jgi:hypothetical protein
MTAVTGPAVDVLVMAGVDVDEAAFVVTGVDAGVVADAVGAGIYVTGGNDSGA